MTLVLVLFSGFLFVRVQQQLEKLSASGYSTEFISKENAIGIAQSQYPQAQITDIEEESLNDGLVYVVELYQNEKETDVYIDRVTGEVLSSAEDGVEVETPNDILINDFEENLLWANIVIVLLTIFLSYFLAGATLRPIQKKMKQQEQFSLDVAHEIRTPLSAILAATDSVLEKTETIQVYRETLSDIKHEAKRLHGLTEDLLKTARGARLTEFDTVDLKKALTRVTGRLAGQAQAKNVTIDLQTEHNFSTLGNQIMVERMFENVLHNAIKFSHHGGTVHLVINDKTVSISDNGIGMSPENISHIFERFYTADSSRNEYNKNGVGLGLSIVRQIANLHRVTITVESEQDRGTVFLFSFLQ
jgi:signal transduction histidine kinase